MEYFKKRLRDNENKHALWEQTHTKQATLQRGAEERLEHIEEFQADSGEHFAQLDRMPSKLDCEREARSEQYTALLERVEYVEKLLDESVGKYAQWEEMNVE